MSFTSRTMVLLGLLLQVASLCVTANAGRELAGTTKLVDLGAAGATVNSVTGEVMNLFANGGRTVEIAFTIVGVSSPVAMAVENGMGGSVRFDVVAGVVNKLAPVAVAVKADRLVAITFTRNAETVKTVTVDLAVVTTAVHVRAVSTSSAVTTAATTVEVDADSPILAATLSGVGIGGF